MTEETHLSTVEKILFLKSVDIFQHAAIEELGRVAALTQDARFEAGETIYREGDPVEAIYIILKGRAVVQSHGKVVREVGEKIAVGVLAALDLGAALRTVTAREPVHVLKLNVQDFQDVLASDFELVKAVFRVVAEQIRQGF
jgi:CRP/FNR family transcriptional regulator, cyclic AMP receptor protein